MREIGRSVLRPWGDGGWDFGVCELGLVCGNGVLVDSGWDWDWDTPYLLST